MLSNEYIIRDAKESDIEDIFNISKLLNTVNLPANKNELEQVIFNSEKSFSLQEKDSTKRAFLFVLCDQSDRVIGTSQIFAKHGTLASPHLYFQVGYDERYSETLKKYFKHRTLKLCQSFDGPTEVGSLVLSNQYRSSKEKLGRTLSYVRFLFMSMKPDFFSSKVLAELLPPLGPNLESALWDAVGRKFTGLEYFEADIISRKNKEFIKTLFPSGEIYVSLLPDNAQEIIGQVGRNSRGAAHLLAKIGFSYSHRVDPFDGGPHYEAELKDISLLKNSLHATVRPLHHPKSNQLDLGLCGRFMPTNRSGSRFKALTSVFSQTADGQVLLPSFTLEVLAASPQDQISIINLSKLR